MKILSKREYKSGSKYCFWRWTYTPSGYITRFHFIKTPWFAICLHFINDVDPEIHHHDHPVSFVSFILKGWYKEIRTVFPKGEYNYFHRERIWKKRKWFNYVKSTDIHRIIQVIGNPCITLCFMGPKVQEWGFYTEEGKIYWKEYNKKYKEKI